MKRFSLVLLGLVACGDDSTAAIDTVDGDTSSDISTDIGDDATEVGDGGDGGDGGDVGDAGDVGGDSPDSAGDATAGDSSVDAPDVDPTADPFPADAVREVALTLPAADWDALRHQLRDPLVIVGADCMAEPWPSPFTWFEASAVIDGATVERTAVRKKGFLTAFETERPALRLDFDRAVPGREVRGMDDMVLNRAVQDPSYVRTCLAYRLFSAAGVPAPRCGFAHVTVNGADLGLYVHVERLDHDFLERHFADPEGNLYEGSSSDFRPEWVGTFQLDSGAGDRSDLAALVTALEADDAHLLEALDAVLDVDQFITYWAMETVLEHNDGYSGNLNNFYVYREPGAAGRFRFIAYGADWVLPSPPVPEPMPVPAVMDTGILARRLYAIASTRTTYLARVSALADELFSESAVASLVAEVDRLEALLAPWVPSDRKGTFTAELDFVRDAIRGRRAGIALGLEDAPATVTQPLRETPCLTELGAIEGSFAASFGTLGEADALTTGEGTLSLTLADTPTWVKIGAVAGQPGGIPVVGVQMIAEASDGRRLFVEIQLPQDRFAPGEVPLELGEAAIYLSWIEDGALRPAGQVLGTLTLTDAAVGEGMPVKGRFTGRVLEAF